jgi:hypothetical protein
MFYFKVHVWSFVLKEYTSLYKETIISDNDNYYSYGGLNID